jgi:hypothetical protein
MSTLDYQGGEILAALESQFAPKLVAKPKPVIKKAPEKPKPASDMPTLFDF